MLQNSSNPIRSKTRRLPRLLLAGAMVLVLAASALLTRGALADATLVNGGFESKNLTGWAVFTNGGNVQVVTNGQGFSANEGSYFALLTAGAADTYQTLSQTVSLDSGATISGYAFFRSCDYEPYNDDGYVRISGPSGSTTVFQSSVPAVGDYGSTGWVRWEYTTSSSGSYTIQAGVRNVLDGVNSSCLGLDGVSVASSTNTNGAPVAGNGTASVAHRSASAVSVSLSATDADNDSLTYKLVGANGGATHGTVTLSGSTANYTPSGDFVGTDTFCWQANDGKTDSNVGVETVTLSNSKPTASVSLSPSQPKTRDAISATAAGQDADGDAVSLSYAWKRNGNVVSGQSGASYSGPQVKGDTITVTVTPNDGHEDGSVATASVTVVNTAPTAGIDSVTVTSGDNADATPKRDGIHITAHVQDDDGDALTGTWTITGKKADGGTGATYTLATGTLAGPVSGNAWDSRTVSFDYTASADDAAAYHLAHGDYSVVLSVKDNDNATATSNTSSGHVPNIAPRLFGVTATTTSGDHLSGAAVVTDPDQVKGKATVGDADGDGGSVDWSLIALDKDGNPAANTLPAVVATTSFDAGATESNVTYKVATDKGILHGHLPHGSYKLKAHVTDAAAAATPDVTSSGAGVPNIPPHVFMDGVAGTVHDHLDANSHAIADADHVSASAHVVDSDGDAVSGKWTVTGYSGKDGSGTAGTPADIDAGAIPGAPDAPGDYASSRSVALADYTAPGHLPHGSYSVRLAVSDPTGGGAAGDPDLKIWNVANIAPHVFAIKWLRASDPSQEVTDTSTAPALSRQSWVASPALGTEQQPGVYLNALASATDADGDQLRITFKVDGQDQQVGNGTHPDPNDANFQTRLLDTQSLSDAATHTLSVLVDDNPAVGASEVLTAQTAPVSITDPREALRQELQGLGFSSIADFQSKMGAVVERAQIDFRIHGWGATQEIADEALHPTAFFNYANNTGTQPYLLQIGARGLSSPADVTSTLLRLDPWVTANLPTVALTPGEQARGEYFAGLLNLEDGRMGYEDAVDLVSPPKTLAGLLLPTIYVAQDDRTPSTIWTFPRQDVDHFDLPDQVLFGDALGMLKNAAFGTLGFLPPPPPAEATNAYLDLADLGRLFNDQTVNLLQGGVNLKGARHRPSVTRVRLVASVDDGSTVPGVTWSYTDPEAQHATQARVIVKVDGTTAVDATDARNYQQLTGLSPGSHTVTIQVFDADGYSSTRTVQANIP